MRVMLLFVLASAGGGLGKIAGILAGAALGPGSGLILQFCLGTAALLLTLRAAVALGALRRQRLAWAAVGGALGVAMATLVTLSTLSSPVAPYLVPMLIGMGATLGSLIGRSAHERTGLT